MAGGGEFPASGCDSPKFSSVWLMRTPNVGMYSHVGSLGNSRMFRCVHFSRERLPIYPSQPYIEG